MFDALYRNKKILITGHSGFKGCWLTTWLLELGADVYGLSRKFDLNPSFFNELKLTEKIHHVETDILDVEKIKKTINKIQPDFLFHLAAQAIVSVSYEDPIGTFNVNALGTANILEALRQSNHPCAAVIVSSDKCYENQEWIWGYRENDRLGGKDPYSASKSIAEIIVKSYYYSFFSTPGSNTKVCTVRSGNVIGGGDWSKDRIVPDCIQAWNNDKSIELRNPYATRPWQHVLDTLNGYLKAGQYLSSDSGVNGEAFNFGPSSDGEHTVLDLVHELSTHWRQLKKSIPFFSLASHTPFKEAHYLKLNCDKALQVLQWKPVLNFKNALHYTADWYNNYYKTPGNAFELTTDQVRKFSQLESG